MAILPLVQCRVEQRQRLCGAYRGFGAFNAATGDPPQRIRALPASGVKVISIKNIGLPPVGPSYPAVALRPSDS